MSILLAYKGVVADALTREELNIWRGFRFMVEETSLGVSRSLSSSAEMSGGEFGILSILIEVSRSSLRQQDLADAMRWDRTRLSHQLTRMEGRGWITRTKGGGGVTLVRLTETGNQELHRATPILGRIVKERFFNRLTQEQLDALEEIRRALEIEKPAESHISREGSSRPRKPARSRKVKASLKSR